MRSYLPWVILGCVLFGGVVAWQLLHGTYDKDVRAICEGETASGKTVAQHPDEVDRFIRDHLTTPEGNAFYSDLTSKRMGDRAKLLGEAAKNAKLAKCPIVDSYVALQTQADYAADLHSFCGVGNEIGGLQYMREDQRSKQLERWLSTQPKSDKMKEFAKRFVAAPSAERAGVLRDETNANAIYGCELVDTLSQPPKEPPADKTAVVSFLPPLIGGELSPAEVEKAMNGKLPEMKKCYRAALDRDATLTGRLLKKISVSAGGKVAKVVETGRVFDKQLSECIDQVVMGMTIGAPAGKLTAVTQPIEFVPILEEPELDPRSSGHHD